MLHIILLFFFLSIADKYRHEVTSVWGFARKPNYDLFKHKILFLYSRNLRLKGVNVGEFWYSRNLRLKGVNVGGFWYSRNLRLKGVNVGECNMKINHLRLHLGYSRS